MSDIRIDQIYNKQDFSNQKLPARAYDGCTFEYCNFTVADISVITFLDCKFIACDFTKVMMKQTSFRDDCVFENCKLLGANFSNCNSFMFSVAFTGCILSYASFYGFETKNMRFVDCKLMGTDFTDAILTGSEFLKCDLTDAIFDQTNLEKVDFRTAQHFTIDPFNNKLKEAKFSKDGLAGLLTRHNLIIE